MTQIIKQKVQFTNGFETVGITSNQLGHNMKVIVIGDKLDSYKKSRSIDQVRLMINPKIISLSSEICHLWEFCISEPE